MAIDANRWLHVPEGVPCVYDVDTQSVDEMGHWVRVRYYALTTEDRCKHLNALLKNHPSGRFSGKTCCIREVDMLPRWMQGRLAVLRMADPDAWVRNVGVRWGSSIRGGSPWGVGQERWERSDDDGYRWYTLDVGCEGVK